MGSHLHLRESHDYVMFHRNTGSLLISENKLGIVLNIWRLGNEFSRDTDLNSIVTQSFTQASSD